MPIWWTKLEEVDATSLVCIWPLDGGQQTVWGREERALERQLATLELPEADVLRWKEEGARSFQRLI